jgi:hypothetical protein
MAVWEIRRYCTVLDHQITLSDGSTKAMLKLELDNIEKSEKHPPQRFKLSSGALEKILDDKEHPAREALVWQNLYFGSRVRKKVWLARYMHSTNSPLSLHPEILDEILRYVYLPKEVVNAYRAELTTRSKGRAGRS